METTLVKLGNDAGNGETRGIDVENDGEIWIEVTEDGSGGEQRFELIEGFFELRRESMVTAH